jgi:hypothetical protein
LLPSQQQQPELQPQLLSLLSVQPQQQQQQCDQNELAGQSSAAVRAAQAEDRAGQGSSCSATPSGLNAGQAEQAGKSGLLAQQRYEITTMSAQHSNSFGEKDLQLRRRLVPTQSEGNAELKEFGQPNDNLPVSSAEQQQEQDDQYQDYATASASFLVKVQQPPQQLQPQAQPALSARAPLLQLQWSTQPQQQQPQPPPPQLLIPPQQQGERQPQEQEQQQLKPQQHKQGQLQHATINTTLTRSTAAHQGVAAGTPCREGEAGQGVGCSSDPGGLDAGQALQNGSAWQAAQAPVPAGQAEQAVQAGDVEQAVHVPVPAVHAGQAEQAGHAVQAVQGGEGRLCAQDALLACHSSSSGDH